MYSQLKDVASAHDIGINSEFRHYILNSSASYRPFGFRVDIFVLRYR